MSSEAFHVGQVVTFHGYGRRAPEQVTVTKVGRKLVYIEQHGRTLAFRIDSGVINDNYGHSRIETNEQYAERQRRSAALDVLRKHKLTTEFGCSLPLETLEQIARILAPGNPDKDGNE